MIDLSYLRGKKVGVLGLGKSGSRVAQALQTAGAQVIGWDDVEERREAAAKQGVSIQNLCETDNITPLDLLVTSPGIPYSFPKPHKAIALAKKHKVPCVGDMELLYQACPDVPYIGITGTNGKSTTTALTGHIFKAHKPGTQVGGNIGVPVMELTTPSKGAPFVLEASSYQLELNPSLRFDVAVLLNITPDHIDRHGSMRGYKKAKRFIFREDPKRTQTFLISQDDLPCRSMTTSLRRQVKTAQIVPFSVERRLKKGISVFEGTLYEDGEEIFDVTTLERLSGQHNWQNLAAAYGAARALGLEPQAIMEAVKTFPGLAHRQEYVSTLTTNSATFRFINDSKATNADATSHALRTYDNIYWIVGGMAKEGGIESLQPYFSKVKRAYLIGEASDLFARTLEGKASVDRCKTLDVAVAHALRDARQDKKNGVVLLSPACASWDQYTSFEARGDHFRRLVRDLLEEQAA